MTHMHIAGQLAPQPCIPCLVADSSAVSHFLPESSKCRVGFGKSVIDFHVNAGFSGEGASQVGERIGSIQWLVIHKDVWLVIHLCGAGWCMTSVFLVLMVKPKLSQALEK